MQFVGDAVMGVFGAPIPQDDHAQKAVEAAIQMHVAQFRVNQQWQDAGAPAFHLGIGLSTGKVAAALLGSEQRLEYSVVGDSVNLAQRLQQFAEGGQTVLSRPTFESLSAPPPVVELPPQKVKGRRAEVHAFLMKETQ